MRRQRTNHISAVEAAAANPPRILYISYDGIGEPLGRSQVLGYLFRLAGDFEVTLVSFEKPGTDLIALGAELRAAGIKWVPQRYHRRPPVLSTLFDVIAARRAIRGLSPPYELVHVRSYVPALIALVSGRERWNRLLFDIRGFWADERVEGGIWPPGGWLYRIAKRCERWFFSEADAVVTLTQASVPYIKRLTGERPVAITVIPTCVDLERFTSRPFRSDGPQAVWSGSIGTWYRFDLVVPLVRALKRPLTVITRQVDLAGELLTGVPARVISRAPENVAEELHAGDIGLCLIKPSFSKIASAPTRLGEYLASGMPVIVTPGVGDLEELVAEEGVGVVLRGEGQIELTQAAQQIRELADDPQVQVRCREVAKARFDVETGSRLYAQIYRSLILSRETS